MSYAPVREILTKTSGFLEAYDYTLNQYSGCSFGCVYCYASSFVRTDEERDSWGQWVRVKDNAIRLMEAYPPGALNGKLIYMSSVTDPYQPVERKLGLTRRLLEVLADRHSPRLVPDTQPRRGTRLRPLRGHRASWRPRPCQHDGDDGR